MAETLCQKRALEAFNLDPAKWGGRQLQTAKASMMQFDFFCFKKIYIPLDPHFLYVFQYLLTIGG